MKNEIWKPITQIVLRSGVVHTFEGYEVSNFGRVRSYKQKYGQVSQSNIMSGLNRPLRTVPKIINGRPDNYGYPQFCLSDINKVRKNFRSHVLVMQTFVGLPEEGQIICHADDVKTNNHISNLRYGTYADNGADMVKNSKK